MTNAEFTPDDKRKMAEAAFQMIEIAAKTSAGRQKMVEDTLKSKEDFDNFIKMVKVYTEVEFFKEEFGISCLEEVSEISKEKLIPFVERIVSIG